MLTPTQTVDRVVVIGLDCASPWLFFERWRAELPNISALMSRGLFGPLRSCHPPITVPAWRVMASGKDAGENGVYGFRSRVGPAPGDIGLTHSGMFAADPVWRVLGKAGLRSTVVGVPGTWPPEAIAGKLISGPMTPEGSGFAQPSGLEARVSALTEGRYAFDIPAFRHEPPEVLLDKVSAMTAHRFDVVEALAEDDDWNLLWMVEIGLDRLYHAIWDCVDPSHPRFVEGSPLAEALLGYHKLLDDRIGRLVAMCDDGDTAFLVVSDHGARSMQGGIHINGWLMREGHLVLREPMASPARFDVSMVDWSKTRAWASGGYCGRVFANVRGREPEGIVDPSDVDALLTEIAGGLSKIPGPDGSPILTGVHRTESLYALRRGWAPDLVVYFGDLAYRALDTVGAEGLYSESNDAGPDAANHDWDGILVAAGAGIENAGRVDGARLLDVAPTIGALLGVEV